MFETKLICALFLTCWGMLPVIWYFLVKFAGLSLTKLTLPIFVLLFILFFQYIGIPILYFQLDPYQVEMGLTDASIILKIWSYTSATITLMLIGCILARMQLGELRWKNSRYYNGFYIGDSQYIILIMVGLFCGSILVMYLRTLGVDKIALLAAINSSQANITASLRSDMGNAFEGGYHWYKIFMRDVLLFVWLILFSDYIVNKCKVRLFPIMVFGFLLAFSMIVAVEKIPIFEFILSIPIVYYVSIKRSMFSMRFYVAATLFLLAIIIFFYFYVLGAPSIAAGVSAFLSRVFTGQIAPAYFYLEMFPKVENWLFGRSFSNPGGILPYEPYRLTVEVMNYRFPGLESLGVVGSAPTVYWAEMYANFSTLGVLIPPLLVGYLLYFGNYLIFRTRFTPVNVSFFVVVLLHYKNLAATGLSGFIIDFSFFVLLTFFTFFNLLDNIKTKTKGNVAVARRCTGNLD